jgi:hypothetical protein
MSRLEYEGGARFVRPSEIIARLKETRTLLTLTTADFQLFGTAEFQKAAQSGTFISNTEKAALYVMCGNSSANAITEQGTGVGEISHAIDIVLYLRQRDDRGQRADQVCVWFKEYLVRSLFGFEAYEGTQPLIYGGDQFIGTTNVEGYTRTYQFTQTVFVDRDDIIGEGSPLEDFTLIFNEITADAPPFGDTAQKDISVDLPGAE